MAQVKRIHIYGQSTCSTNDMSARDFGVQFAGFEDVSRCVLNFSSSSSSLSTSQNTDEAMDTSSPPSVDTSPSLPDSPNSSTMNHLSSLSSPSSSNTSPPGYSEMREFFNQLMNSPDTLERIISGRECYQKLPGHSRCIVDYINSRSCGNTILQRASLAKNFVLNHLLTNNVLREREYNLGEINKVFCSKWLNERQVILGTKCNKLIVVDLYNGKMFQIPNLRSSGTGSVAAENCGIHCVEINPSKTLLATGGEYPNDIAVYKLPSLEPVCLGEHGHTDWIFDACWLDDQHFVTGSRDTKLALWRVDEELLSWKPQYPGHYTFIKPVWIHRFTDAEKIRALLFNERRSEIVALSLNAQLHQFDINSLRQKNKLKLTYQNDNVCLAQINSSEKSLYAVGSRTHVSLVDQRTFDSFRKINISPQGIRSLSFSSDTLTIGTGSGAVLFYDIRNNRLINYKDRVENVSLNVAKGWLSPSSQEMLLDMEYNPAIYTHQYDSTGTRLFTAGGPLTAGQVGNFASLWT